MASRWRNWLQRRTDEISPWVGLTFGALFLVAVTAVGVAAVHVQKEESAEQQLSETRRWTGWLARYLAHVHSQGPEAMARELRRAAREEGVDFCAVVSAEGVFVAHSELTLVGSPGPHLSWTESSANGVRTAEDPGRPHGTVHAARILSPAGVATTDELWVGSAPLAVSWLESDLLFYSGYVLLTVLGLYLVAYRLFRRAVQPLAAIRGRLIECDKPIPERLLALRLNDSFDQISASWNQLIEFIAQSQEELRHRKLTADVTAAMDGYRSERLTNILLQIPFGVLVVDAEEMISFANRAAVGMLGKRGEPLDNTPAGAILPESLRMDLFSPHRAEKSRQAAASRWTDFTFKRPHGEITLRFWSIPGDAGEREYVVFLQDVTQAKEAERARDQFLYHVTHELRTPLTNIRAYAETLSQGVIDDEQTVRECYNVIMGETQRLNRLVEDILNVSQLEVGTARLDIGEVQLDKLIRTVVQDMQGGADEKNIDLLLHMPPKMPRLRGDKERLAVVLTNLVGNAIKYTPGGGRVEVRCTPESNRVRISVSDTGIGIKPDDQERIFDKFYRADDEQVSAIPGTGLGLAIAQETVRVHGGGISVASTPGKGSTFTVVLPAIPLEADENGSNEKRISSVEEL